MNWDERLFNLTAAIVFWPFNVARGRSWYWRILAMGPGTLVTAALMMVTAFTVLPICIAAELFRDLGEPSDRKYL